LPGCAKAVPDVSEVFLAPPRARHSARGAELLAADAPRGSRRDYCWSPRIQRSAVVSARLARAGSARPRRRRQRWSSRASVAARCSWASAARTGAARGCRRMREVRQDEDESGRFRRDAGRLESPD
jgi:hypothetical protein